VMTFEGWSGSNGGWRYIEMNVSPLPVGTGLSRYVKALVNARGQRDVAAAVAASWADSPAVRLTLEKAATTPQSSADLAAYGLSQEFYELYRAQSLVGRLSDRFRRAPFRQKIPAEGSGVTAAWIPESGRTPATAMTWTQIELPEYKLGVLAVISEELARMSTPAADEAIRRILVSAVGNFVDAEFLGTDAAVAGTSPGGIAAGQESHVSTGSAAAQVRADLSAMVAKLGSFESPAWLTRPRTMAHLASVDLVEFATGQPLLWGWPIFTSPAAPAAIVLTDLSAIYLADDGVTEIDPSSQATVLMDDGLSPASESEVGLWMNNLSGIKVIRYISWAAGHTSAVVRMATAY
jgi:HK97 family phage major capsid protein